MIPPHPADSSSRPAAPDDAAGRPVFLIVLIYGVFAGLWILFSDRAMEALFDDPAQIVRVSMIKGWLFVAVTTVLLYGLMRRMVQRLQASHQREIDGERERTRALDLLAAIADSADDAIFAKDLTGRYILFNRGAEHMSGKSRGAALGRDDTAVFPAETAALIQAKDREILARGELLRYEEGIPGPQGMLTLEVTKIPLRDAAQRIFGICGIARDITQRKLAEEKLRRSEEKFRQLFEASRDALIIAPPPDWRFVAANQAALDMLGAAQLSEMTALCPWDISPERQPDGRASAAAAREHIEEALQTGTSFFEWTLKRLNGELLTADVLLTRFEEQGRFSLQATLRDISERRRAEQILRESEARFRALFDNAAVAMYVHDRNTGELIDANRQAIASYACATLDELKREPFRAEPPYSGAEALAFIRKAASDGPQRFEWLNRNRDGDVFWQDVLLNPMSLNGTERILAIATDITARKRAEEELRQRQSELERFNRAAVGRELEMVELKRKVNALSVELGRAPPFPLSFIDADRGETA